MGAGRKEPPNSNKCLLPPTLAEERHGPAPVAKGATAYALPQLASRSAQGNDDQTIFAHAALKARPVITEEYATGHVKVKDKANKVRKPSKRNTRFKQHFKTPKAKRLRAKFAVASW